VLKLYANKLKEEIMITKDMSITEIVQKYPQLIEVFQSFGLG